MACTCARTYIYIYIHVSQILRRSGKPLSHSQSQHSTPCCTFSFTPPHPQFHRSLHCASQTVPSCTATVPTSPRPLSLPYLTFKHVVPNTYLQHVIVTHSAVPSSVSALYVQTRLLKHVCNKCDVTACSCWYRRWLSVDVQHNVFSHLTVWINMYNIKHMHTFQWDSSPCTAGPSEWRHYCSTLRTCSMNDADYELKHRNLLRHKFNLKFWINIVLYPSRTTTFQSKQIIPVKIKVKVRTVHLHAIKLSRGEGMAPPILNLYTGCEWSTSHLQTALSPRNEPWYPMNTVPEKVWTCWKRE